MPNIIKKITVKDIFSISGRRGVSLRRRLMLYLLSLIVTGLLLLVLILFLTGVFSEKETGQILEIQLGNTKSKLEDRIGFIAGSGLELSKSLTKAVEKELEYPYDIHSITNNKEAILGIEKSAYPILENYLDVARVSGAFMMLDTTVNDRISGSANSRSGVQIHLGNVSSTSSFEKDVYLFRGMSEIARENHIRMHNRWMMEMDTAQMSWFETQLGASSKQFFLTSKSKLGRTWEDLVYISVPIEGRNGESYGVSGLAMSGLLFRLSHPTIVGEYGVVITVMAPLDGDEVFVREGLVGEESELSKQEVLHIKKGKNYNVYQGANGEYIGLHAPLGNVLTQDGKQWNVFVLIPDGTVQGRMHRNHRILILGIAFFVFTMFAASMYISKRYVKPIVDSIEKIKNESDQTITGISELDALSEYMRSKQAQKENMPSASELPPSIKELFDNFIERSKRLTEAERGILRYYIKGYSIAEIPDIAFISLNTVRKHNRNIYEKLEIGSIDELKLYIDFLGRLDMLGEIE